jgi:hypothetical protein
LVALATAKVLRLVNIPVEEINASKGTDGILALIQGRISMQVLDTKLNVVSKVTPLGIGSKGQQRYLFLSTGIEV